MPFAASEHCTRSSARGIASRLEASIAAVPDDALVRALPEPPVTAVKRFAATLSAARLVVCFIVAALALLARPAVAAQSLPRMADPQNAQPQARPDIAVSPAEWAELALAPCRRAGELARAADAALAERLASSVLSREQAAFLKSETKVRARVDERARRGTLARLDALLSGDRARFPDAESGGRDSFRDVLNGLLGREQACALEAVEATVLFGIFGVPFEADTARDVRPDREFQRLDAVVGQHVSAGYSLDRIFQEMRGPQEHAARFIEAVVRAASPALVSSADGSAEIDSKVEHRLQQFLEFITYAAEPVRIRNYLHMRVDEIEGAVRAPFPDAAEERLADQAERALFGSVDAMRRLRQAAPAEVLDALAPVVDRWFRTVAVPALRQSLADDPFGAYWFYIQTGGVPAPGSVFKGSSVTAHDPAFTVTELAALPVADALARLKAIRIPAEFVERHALLESAFSEVTLSRDDVLVGLGASGMPDDVRARLRDLLLEGGQSARFSTLDVYTHLIRDASRISGDLDTPLIAAASDLLRAEKSDRLEEEIDRILAAEPSHDHRLENYLETAAALMLEIEQRQALESAFRQSTSGAAIGWLLSQFFIGGTVPVGLWAPDGVTGAEFSELIDELTPKNHESGNVYAGKPATSITLVRDGVAYHDALVHLIDSASHFLNIAAFDWKTDPGGRDIAYRLMAKKLGIDGTSYSRFLGTFERGLPLDPSDASVVAFYDIPTTRVKDLLVSYFFLTSDHPDVAAAREAARKAGATLECATVRTCGDLEALRSHAGRRYDRRNLSPAHHGAWRAYQLIEGLFAKRTPALNRVHPRRALRDYVEDPEALRRLVRRTGLRRADRPREPFAVNIVADAKQNLSNIRFGERSEQFPHFVVEPIRDIYFPLLEFDIRVMLWKGAMEFPWRIGPIPVGGRKILGIIPMPFIPWPWLNAVPGFGWAGTCTSLLLQYLLATDVRIWWASVSHTKSWSNESTALESGMGMGAKYYNEHDTHKTWHDMGVVVRGAPVDDVNDHFVQVFNEVRVNNAGLPTSRGVSIPRLRYEDYTRGNRAPEGSAGHRTWLLTTHPERGDANYRGVFVAALAAARHNIYIENPFFSDPLIARMLIRKAREFRARVSCEARGSHECAVRMREAVQIHLVLPDTSDKPLVDAIGTADFDEMLHLGIKVHRWRPEQGWSAASMLHSKVWLIDYDPGRGGLAYVGAANVTQRSHIADNEAGLLSNDPGFARQVYEGVFQPDIATDSRMESGETFHITRSSSSVIRASRWLRRLLVELFWFI
jgi:phosphatidylserine/phosphatidylglycerophosphate/cardiolipin synthase-like enzyme